MKNHLWRALKTALFAILSVGAGLAIGLSFPACSSSSGGDAPGGNANPIQDPVTITLDFEYGEDITPTSTNGNIYAIWVSNDSLSYIQNLSLSERLVKVPKDQTITALPYWRTNILPWSSATEVDAVSAATERRKDFTVTATLREPAPRSFTLYFETDRSFDTNDWFSDQPAILYTAEIDLDHPQASYALVPAGWTPNGNTENVIPSTPAGTLQDEMRYITHEDNGSGGFGSVDSRGATKMVAGITARVTEE